MLRSIPIFQCSRGSTVINLDRFSVFFPELRPFFTENSDLFSDFGFRRIRPFFSRNIGLSSGSPVNILGGLRLSGNVSDKTRIGLMTMQTKGTADERNLESENYGSCFFNNRYGIVQALEPSWLTSKPLMRQGLLVVNAIRWPVWTLTCIRKTTIGAAKFSTTRVLRMDLKSMGSPGSLVKL